MRIKLSGNLFPIILAVLIILPLSVIPLSAESVFLKDGSILNGTIVSASDDAVTLRMDDDELKQIPRKNIIKILYTKIKTPEKNVHPDRPVIASVENAGSGNRKITWLPSSDPDGIVINYRIYGTTGDTRRLIGNVKATEFLLKNALTYDRIELAAVDDKTAESDSVKVNIEIDIKKTILGFFPGIIVPMGKSDEICNTGYGGMLTLSKRDILLDGIEAGIGSGFYYAGGNDLLDEGKPDYDRFIITPFFINSGYIFKIDEKFSFTPMLSFGGAYVHLTYTHKDLSTMKEIETSRSFIDPIAKGGVKMNYNITGDISLSLLAEYGFFIETAGSIPFMIAGLGIEYGF